MSTLDNPRTAGGTVSPQLHVGRKWRRWFPAGCGHYVNLTGYGCRCSPDDALGDVMGHPAASVEYRVRTRARTRLHVEQHPVLPDHLLVTFGHADADLEITLDVANAVALADTVNQLVDLILPSLPSHGQVTA